MLLGWVNLIMCDRDLTEADKHTDWRTDWWWKARRHSHNPPTTTRNPQIQTDARTHTHARTHAHNHTTHNHVHTDKHTHKHTHIHAHKHNKNTHKHTQSNTHTHTHTHLHTHCVIASSKEEKGVRCEERLSVSVCLCVWNLSVGACMGRRVGLEVKRYTEVHLCFSCYPIWLFRRIDVNVHRNTVRSAYVVVRKVTFDIIPICGPTFYSLKTCCRVHPH
jgi:hypothetical protein